ncbi:pyridoxal phosphate-dependent aminotransferase, partial [Streptomyces sp. SID9727]|nr:pyridoxal phosphate-dependent aminotransferase [Streptomyces sp. SID9727]
ALHARLATEAHRAVLGWGALARPPQAGRHLYADLGPLRSRLAARGVSDSLELEEYLSARLGTPAPGGHRFGDELGALRVRLGTGSLLGTDPERQAEALTAPDPLELPHIAEALSIFRAALDAPR